MISPEDIGQEAKNKHPKKINPEQQVLKAAFRGKWMEVLQNDIL